MRRLLLAVACTAILCGAEIARAQTYPSRPITIVVPYAAGGGADILARILAERMRVSLGQAAIVENVAGAAGSIGVGRVARAAPDGHTVALGNWSTHVANGAVYALSYDLLKDFEPISLVASNPLLIAAKKSIPANTLKELIAWLTANPDRASQGTNGPGSIMHLAGILFQRETGTRFQFVPYRGGAAAMQDLLGGRIDMVISLSPDILSQARSGNIKVYAVTSKSRLEAAPDVPTVDEAGLPGLYVSAWFGLWAPKRAAKDAIAKLNGAVIDALADPAVRLRLAELGLELPPHEQQKPEMLGAFQKAEIEKWWPIIKAAGIKAE